MLVGVNVEWEERIPNVKHEMEVQSGVPSACDSRVDSGVGDRNRINN
jgi:hypothetical protein